MFPEFEACNTTRSTITEVPFSRYSGSISELLVARVFSLNSIIND